MGNVPLEWYEDFPHVGYDLDGRRIYKPLRTRDELDQFLDKMDDPDFWSVGLWAGRGGGRVWGKGFGSNWPSPRRTVKDRMTGHDLRLTDEQVALVQRLQRGQFGDVSFDPYEVGWDGWPWGSGAGLGPFLDTTPVSVAGCGLLQRGRHDPPGDQSPC